ncbi:MAG TPA: PaaI family thioesterase [Solimonas sp.]|nr:PaaI family thioesterase [Solimonas sp.]
MSTDPMDAAALTAAGWTRIDTTGFTSTIGPLWRQGSDQDCSLAFLAEERHSNNSGAVHGGALMTFADICLGYRGARALGHTACVTAQLQLQFISGARIGELVSCKPELIRLSSQLIFVRGLISAGGRTVASADGIWKILDPRPRA